MAKAKAENTPAKKAEVKAPKKAEVKAPKKAAAKSAGKAPAKKEAGKENQGLMKPLNVSSDLIKIVGNEPLPRTQIIKKMWDYIKANDLQDKENKRMINADDNLKVVFGGKEQVSMFELAKIINNHVQK